MALGDRVPSALVIDRPGWDGSSHVTDLAGKIPGAELVEIAHAGHLLHVQHASRVADVIADPGG